MQQPIIGYDQDELGDWRAILACGHRQHVRHDPPLVERPWVLTPDGRARFLGHSLDCKRCDEGEPVDGGAEGRRSRGAEEQRSRGAEEQRSGGDRS